MSSSDAPTVDGRAQERRPRAGSRWRVHRRRAGASVLAVALALAGCAGDGEGPDDGTPAPVAPEERPDGLESTGAPAEGGEPDTETTSADENGGSPGEQNPPADDGESPADVEGSSADDDTPPEPQGTGDDVTPPGFSASDSVLTEDAFDGPDLSLDSVELVVDDTQQQVTFLLGGSGFPGWEVGHVEPGEAPVGDGTQSVLRVELVGVGSTGVADADLPEPDGRVTELVVEDPQDHRLIAYVGLGQQAAPFRVHLQHSPLRLVVEVADGG